MSSWLTRLPERTRDTGELTSWVDAQRPAYLVLDQRRYPEASADLLGQAGKCDFVTLFATTPLAPLIDASPWLIELDVGSEAWQHGEALCREQRLGWAFQPAHNAGLDDLADHLRRLFVLDDSHGGQSLINIQDPTAWTALLAAGSDNAYAQLIGPLGQVITPTPLTHWQAWQPVDTAGKPPGGTIHDAKAPPLTHAVEQALKDGPRAWWLSRVTQTPLSALPPVWLERLKRLEAAGIHQAHHIQRLLPRVRQAQHPETDWWSQASTMERLDAAMPAWQKVDALEAHA
ncbi:DUF4123 domain-containing protein [Billgrantia kenyensis]|uniref:DUF4123 domain-containing protein n=1 Tax=Billgrantia kenyensis TaxID=321266 RepID=A0A7W0ACZ4_9GAMM|nr:DUF4123 domain-containing protein [Halomonas kenyensis]MBA2778030.1 DUF4123 domain-containing protein [Halomonas kenyensis]MCG6661192.1 DUF4123 domain-containing protein [Halomonas kenyensis]